MNDVQTLIAIIGLIIAWTIAVLAALIWLTRQFSIIKEDLARFLTIKEYDDKHRFLEARLRDVELCMREIKATLKIIEEMKKKTS